MGNSSGNADKKSTKTGQNDKRKESTGICKDKKTCGNKPESPGERWKIKEISTKVKTIQTK